MNYNQYSYMQQPAYPQTQYIPLTFVSGIEGAKAFIVAPNQTVYLRDSDSDTLFIKSADVQGRYSLKVYTLVPTEAPSKHTPEYVTIDTLNNLKKELEEKINKLGGTHE